MFERYVQAVNPDEERFQTVISKYLSEKGIRESQALTYSELYKVIKEGIREYIRREESRSGSKK